MQIMVMSIMTTNMATAILMKRMVTIMGTEAHGHEHDACRESMVTITT